MNKKVILSTDNNAEYYNLLPLVCHSWRKFGYDPVIITVGMTKEQSDLLGKHCQAEMFFIKNDHGIKDSTIAQLVRLFAYENYAPDVELITADADMVIARDIFTHDVSQGQIVSYGFDLTGRSELPICYVRARADKWRELMGEFYIPDAAYSDKWESYWSTDQQLLTQRAHEYGMNRITFIDRGNQNKHGLPTGRWDRHDWAHIPDSIIDVHMKRNDWDAQIQVAERLWPGEDHSFITKFREALEGNKLTESIQGIAEACNYPTQMLSSSHTVSSQRVAAQAELIFVEEGDQLGFLKGVTGNWNNHLPLLLLGLHLTNGDVYEFGAGEGSTPYLRSYCKANSRYFQSWENNKEWAEKCGSLYVEDWNNEGLFWSAGVVFIDHAPGEQRIITIAELAKRNETDIIVIHDTEEGGAGDYKYDRIWPLFKYRLNYNKTGGGAGATMVSNKIDVSRFRGLSLGQFKFDND
jgi:hypothetical protein